MMSVTAETVGLTIADAAVLPVPVGRLSVEKYHKMIRQGILTENDRMELLDGILVRKMTINPPHRLVTQLLDEVLRSVLPQGWHVQTQSPVTLTTSEPESDGMIVRGGLRDYRERHPSPSEVAIAIEVADATLATDRTLKMALYAQAGIAVYWVVNLIDRQIEVYMEPTGAVERPGYAGRRDYSPLDEVPVVIAGHDAGRIPVANLLP